MKASKEYLEEALSAMGDVSDTEKAKALKIAGSTLSLYRSGDRKMDDYACIMVARVLGLDPMEIIAACQEEREKSEERREFWKDFRQTLGAKLAAVLTIGTAMMMAPNPAQAAALSHIANHDVMFIMSNKRRKKAAKTPLSHSAKAIQRLLQFRYTKNLQNA